MTPLRNKYCPTTFILVVLIFVFTCGPKPTPQSKFKNFLQEASDKVSEGDYENALKYYRKALKINYKEPQLYREMAYCFEKMSMNDSAITYYEGAIVFNPKDIDSYQSIGNIYYKQKMYHEAMTWYDRGMELGYLYPQNYCRLASIYYRWGEYDRAKDYYKNAIMVDSSFSEAYYGLGLVNYLSGDTVMAETYFLSAFDTGPNPNSAFMLGKIFFEHDQFAKAEKWFDSYLELNPNGDFSYKAKEYKRIIMIRRRSGEK